MSAKLKSIADQVIVITGASSGIGLATAEMAARKGARVVLAARSIQTLEEIRNRLVTDGAQVEICECDVSRHEDVERLAALAIQRFGRIDTWVNNAGTSIYGRLQNVSEEDHRRLFDVNFWGIVNGSLVALEHLRKEGGALINIGSEVSDAVIPLQGMYSASKHAVKGFTDALRVEVEEVDALPIAITLIQPTAVNTPFPQHARNYMPQEPKLPTPMIDPKAVAEAILDCAAAPTRERSVGTMAKVNKTLARILPRLSDKIAARQVDRQQYAEPPRNPGGTLFAPCERVGGAGRIHGSGGRTK